MEAPVKFIVKNEAIEENNKNHAIISKVFPVIFENDKMAAAVRPIESPLNAKLLPGSHGSNAGPITAPQKKAAKRFIADRKPFLTVRSVE